MLEKQFLFSKRGPGLSGLHQLPVFSIHDWDLVAESPQRLRYRTGMRALINRLGITFVVGVALALIYFGFYRDFMETQPIPDQDPSFVAEMEKMAHELTAGNAELQRTFQQSQEEFNRKQQAAREDYIAKRHRAGQVVQGIMLLIALLGLYPPVSVLWSTLTLEIDLWNNLRIRKGGLIPRTRVWPADAFQSIAYGAEERIHRGQDKRTHGGWRWFVRLYAKSDLPLPAIGAGIPPNQIEFQIHYQRDRPVTGVKPPAPVVKLVNWLKAVTRAEVQGPLIVDDRAAAGSFFQGRVPVQTVGPVTLARGPVTETRTEFKSLDEMPPELRSKFEKLMAQGRTSEVVTHSVTVESGGPIVYRDQNGIEHRYRSIDEMPPDIRSLFDHFQK